MRDNDSGAGGAHGACEFGDRRRPGPVHVHGVRGRRVGRRVGSVPAGVGVPRARPPVDAADRARRAVGRAGRGRGRGAAPTPGRHGTRDRGTGRRRTRRPVAGVSLARHVHLVCGRPDGRGAVQALRETTVTAGPPQWPWVVGPGPVTPLSRPSRPSPDPPPFVARHSSAEVQRLGRRPCTVRYTPTIDGRNSDGLLLLFFFFVFLFSELK